MTPKPQHRACCSCRHWTKFRTAQQNIAIGEPPQATGECRRHPPVLDHNSAATLNDAVTDSSIPWVWPITLDNHGCGEYASLAPWPFHKLLAWDAT